MADLIAELIGRCVKPVKIFVDNKLAIDLAKNPVFHSRSKHIKFRYHYVRTCVQNGDVEVIHIPSTEHRANILTKSLRKEKLCYFRNLIGMSDVGTGKEIKGENVGK